MLVGLVTLRNLIELRLMAFRERATAAAMVQIGLLESGAASR